VASTEYLTHSPSYKYIPPKTDLFDIWKLASHIRTGTWFCTAYDVNGHDQHWIIWYVSGKLTTIGSGGREALWLAN